MRSAFLLSFILVAFVLSQCASQEVVVYERLTSYQVCKRYTDYQRIAQCEREQMMQERAGIHRSVRISSNRLEKMYNTVYKCEDAKFRAKPTGCSVSMIPQRAPVTRKLNQ